MPTKMVLRVATLLVPSISIEFFEALIQYLEQKMGCETSLTYESRVEGPPAHMFQAPHSVDVAFMTANGYLSTCQEEFCGYELLPLSIEHERDTGSKGPAVHVEVVVNRNMKDMQSVHELKGCRWVRNVTDRLTSALTLYQLNAIGTSALFFSNVLKSKSHLESLRMILQRKAHASAVDSNALQMFLRENPNDKTELYSIATWGPLPPYAIVVRKTIDPSVRKELIHALLNMQLSADGRQLLSSFKIKRFCAITTDDFEVGNEYIEVTKGLSFDAVYY